MVLVTAFQANVEAHLDISGEQVKLEPLVNGAAKSVLMDVENILEAVIINESKSKGTALFRSVGPTLTCETERRLGTIPVPTITFDRFIHLLFFHSTSNHDHIDIDVCIQILLTSI